jgi:hypothetical protein
MGGIPNSYPMPGPNEFSAEEEQQMRQGRAKSNFDADSFAAIGAPPAAKWLKPSPPDDATDEQ